MSTQRALADALGETWRIDTSRSRDGAICVEAEHAPCGTRVTFLVLALGHPAALALHVPLAGAVALLAHVRLCPAGCNEVRAS